jgi:hypothetical protein
MPSPIPKNNHDSIIAATTPRFLLNLAAIRQAFATKSLMRRVAQSELIPKSTWKTMRLRRLLKATIRGRLEFRETDPTRTLSQFPLDNRVE